MHAWIRRPVLLTPLHLACQVFDQAESACALQSDTIPLGSRSKAEEQLGCVPITARTPDLDGML